MRITGGRARSIPVKTVRGTALRPSADRTRQAVFSAIGRAVVGASVLDLFAGTGAYGLEAMSRGADHVHFVEKNPRHTQCLEINIEFLLKSIDKPVNHGLSLADVFTWKPRLGKQFDLIFADPPYNELSLQIEPLLERVQLWLRPGPNSYFILEAPANFSCDCPGMRLLRHLGKGKNPSQPSVLIYSTEINLSQITGRI